MATANSIDSPTNRNSSSDPSGNKDKAMSGCHGVVCGNGKTPAGEIGTVGGVSGR